MKYLLFLLLILASILSTKANIQVDTSSYEEQRKRVNSLLDARAKKFGDLDQSFNKKSGIFGLVKSKKDMQKSINILQEIVKYDNLIFIETRKLLAIKDNHAIKYKQLAKEYDEQVTAYMKTISKLQMENETLRKQIANNQTDQNSSKRIFIFLTIIFLLLAFFIFKTKLSKK